MSRNLVVALGKNGSFGFAKCWLVCRAKPNVPFVRLARRNFKKCEGLAFSFFSVICPNSKTRLA